ncbi:MAG: RNA methyltransferase [Candidatus Methanomethylicus sp.]|nr:RNA methyltransferase [Candidatus Methanomethylicus sp.]
MILKRKNSITIFLPVSILADVPSLVEKTFKIGQIARAASIYRVDGVVIYRESSGSNREDALLIRDILNYVETPQYLRKKLFPLSESLRFAGMLPPLRTPHHPLESTKIDYREGFVLRSDDRGSLVDVGLRSPVTSIARLPLNRRVTMRLVDGLWVPSSKDDVPYYWGYSVSLEFKGLTKLLESSRFDSIIATSRIGTPLAEATEDLRESLATGKNIALLFGSPAEGLHEIVKREGAEIEDLADLVVNLAPDQGTATIRTEEAVMISLAVMASLEATTHH